MATSSTLYIRIGPMFSGKSLWLNSELTCLADVGYHVLRISHSLDIRGDDPDVVTTHHSGHKLSHKVHRVRAAELANVDVEGYNVIGIDEAQFFPDLVVKVTEWLHAGLNLRVVGLCGDHRMQKFGAILDLAPLADEIVKLRAYCLLCIQEQGHVAHNTASFTKRIAGGDEQILIGGKDKYMAVCRRHHLQ